METKNNTNIHIKKSNDLDPTCTFCRSQNNVFEIKNTRNYSIDICIECIGYINSKSLVLMEDETKEQKIINLILKK